MRHRAVFFFALPTFLLIAVGRNLDGPDLDPAFAFDFPAAIGVPVAIIGLGLFLLFMLRPAAAETAVRTLAAATRPIPARLRLPLLAAGFAGLCLLLPARGLSGDAGAVLERAAIGGIYPSNALTDILTLTLIRLSGLEPVHAIMALSVLSGACFAGFAAGLAKECGGDTAGRAALLALLLTCGAALLFFGRVEVYAAPAAAMTAYLWLAARRVNGKDRGLLAPLVLGVAFAFHGAAGLLLPTLLFLEPAARPRFVRAVGRGLLFLAPVVATAATLQLLSLHGPPPPGQAQFGSFFGFLEQGPLLPLIRGTANLTTRYAIFDPDHLLGVLNLLLLGAPVGLPLLLIFRRGLLQSPLPRFAAVAALPFVMFLLVWNVSFPLRYDWDLFAAAGVPLTLLGVMAFPRRPEDRSVLLALVVVSLATFAARVLREHGDREVARTTARVFADVYGPLDSAAAERWGRRAEELDTTRAEADHRRALAALEEGRLEDAERLCRAVLAREPDHHGALVSLGMALRAMERTSESRAVLARAVRTDPRDLRPRWLLAGIALEEGKDDKAIYLLERGIRAGGLGPSVVEVLKLLAHLYERRGDAERASQARRLLDARTRAISASD
jgi:Flp pilus assembly protein TadD